MLDDSPCVLHGQQQHTPNPMAEPPVAVAMRCWATCGGERQLFQVSRAI